MQYTITEQGICYKIEDDEADEVDRLLDMRLALATESKLPDIPIADAVKVCQQISAKYDASFALPGCECEAIGMRHCGMCE